MTSLRTAARIDNYRRALTNPNVRAILRVLREGESSQDPDAYRWLFGSTRARPKVFDSFADHPRVRTYEAFDGQFIRNGKIDFTTAAGAYQIVASTWDSTVKSMIAPPDFSPEWQDLAAVALMDFRKALDDVIAGRFEAALVKLRDEWASLPTSTVGQPTVGMDRARRVYEQWGGTFAPATPVAPTPAPTAPPAPSAPLVQPGPEPSDYYAPSGEAPEWVPPPPKEKPMAPFIAAALPAIVQSIPQLAKLFGSGSEVAQRNIAAAEAVVGIVQQAVGASNAQEAAELVQSDPQARAKASEAVQARWYTLAEAGGGGIDGARKADAAARASGESVWRSPSLLIAICLLPLVYMVLTSVLFGIGPEWPSDVRAAIATAIVSMVVGAISGYYFGQTTSRNRTPQ
jgi:muramidase (phage lysozyme)